MSASSASALVPSVTQASHWLVPPELIILIFEHFLALPRRAGHQRDLANLCLTCKLFNTLATPQLFNVIDLRDSKKVMSVINAISADPKRAERVKAVWWNLGSSATSSTSDKRTLVRLSNVEEVAWYAREMQSSGLAGCHVSLRKRGAWCDASAFEKYDPVWTAMGSPTLPGLEPSSMALYSEEEATVPDAEVPPRAIWALSLVTSSFCGWCLDVIQSVRTLTHLTITLYSNIPDDLQMFEIYMGGVFEEGSLPLLTEVVVRAATFGEGRDVRRRNRERRLKEVCARLNDDRLRIEEMPSFVPQGSVGADVVEYTHQQWMERAYGLGPGPWADPQTATPSSPS